MMKQKLLLIVMGCGLGILSNIQNGWTASIGVACWGFSTLSDVACFSVDDTPIRAAALTLVGSQVTARYLIPLIGSLSFDPVLNRFRLTWQLSFAESAIFDQAAANLDPQTLSGPVTSRIGVRTTMVFRSFGQSPQAAQAARQTAAEGSSLPDMLQLLLQFRAGN